MNEITDERLRQLRNEVTGHIEAGEEEYFISAAEMRDLLCELARRRSHECESLEQLQRRANETWGYDG